MADNRLRHSNAIPETESVQQISINDLPAEILEVIFEQLLPNVTDLLVCKLVSKWWNRVAQRLLFDTVSLILQHDIESRSLALCPVDEEDINHVCRSYVFKDCEIRQDSPWQRQLWLTIGSEVHSITLSDCFAREADIIKLLAQCCNLRALRLRNMDKTFMSESLLTKASDRTKLQLTLSCVREVELSGMRYINDRLLASLMEVLPPLLTSLSFSGSNVCYHQVIRNRFYPVREASDASDFVLTFWTVLLWVTRETATLRHLDLSSTRISTTGIQSLIAVPGLHLNSLNFSNCLELKQSSLEELCHCPESLQQSLLKLDLSGCNLAMQAVSSVAESFPNLEWLSVHDCNSVAAAAGLSMLRSHPSLRHLDLGNTNLFNKAVVQFDQDVALLPHLRFLSLDSLRLDSRQVNFLLARAVNLMHLDLTECEGVDELLLQTVSGQLVQLRTLLLGKCSELRDWWLMGCCYRRPAWSHLPGECGVCCAAHDGAHRQEEQCQQAPLCRRLHHNAGPALIECLLVDRAVSGAHDPDVPPWLAAADLVQSVTRRHPACIANLTGLVSLSLCSAPLLTDHLLETVLRFSSLRRLDLSLCRLVTWRGLGPMAAHCPALEELLLTRCDRVDDMAVEVVLHHLTRLRALHLQNCWLLTSDALAMARRCKTLRYLDIAGCTRMTLASVEEMEAKAPQLCLVTGSTEYLTSQPNSPSRGPPPPPPPHPILARMVSRILMR